MRKGKALFFIPTAKSPPMRGVWDWVDRTNYVDKLVVRNMQKDTADEIAMQFFFKRGYDYLIVTTDDVFGHPFQVHNLLEEGEKHGFPILTGWCNHLHYYASLCVDPIDSELLEAARGKPWPGLALEEYDFALSRDVVAGAFGYPFFNVWYTGVPLTLIRKDALRKVPFREWRLRRDDHCVTPEAKREGRGVMQDVQWAIDCARDEIPITVDARIFLLHIFTGLGAGVSDGLTLEVGRKPRVRFVPAVGEKRSPEEMSEINGLLGEIAASAWRKRRLTRNAEL